jgi:hypothetical protein
MRTYKPKKLKGTIKATVPGRNKDERRNGGYDWNNGEVAFGTKYGDKKKED